ncbi:MAG TPA: 4-hydroxy-tetrahydrodipicolinate reductase [Gammaproteobacteria bacterium]|nr:4-hydroxy-tetrahydrodipicolinate reductase [Gammaproteobacteria bacterium]
MNAPSVKSGEPIRIALLGATGRMGREIVAAIRQAPDLRLVAALARADDESLGRDAGEIAGGAALGVALSGDLNAASEKADVWIDFSASEAFAAGLAAAHRAGRAFLSGTTGLGREHQGSLDAAARDIPVLHAANMSFGMAVLDRLVAEAAKLLGEEFDAGIFEMHHRGKKDAPSGSALALGATIAATRGRKPGAEFVRRDENVREPGGIGFASLRGGDVVGDHTVIFAGEGERLELGLYVSERAVFARGALRAAAWLAHRPPGLYRMNDVIGL